MKANDSRLLVQRHSYPNKNGTMRVTGVFVGFYDEVAEKVRTGFSRVNYASGDKFNMEIGLAMAISEAVLPHQFLKDNEENQYFWDHYVAFIDRANRYYQQGLHDVPVNQRPKRAYPKRNGYGMGNTNLFDEIMEFPPVSMEGLNILNDMMTRLHEMKKIKSIKPIMTLADYHSADRILGRIANQFRTLGYSNSQVLQDLMGLGIADEEGLALLKKHFPNLDFSKIKIVKTAKKAEKV